MRGRIRQHAPGHRNPRAAVHGGGSANARPPAATTSRRHRRSAAKRALTAPAARQARDYLRARGLSGDVARRFRLGWAPDDWDALALDLRLPADVLREVGLGFTNKAGRMQDSFRARVMFPIFSENGEPVASRRCQSALLSLR